MTCNYGLGLCEFIPDPWESDNGQVQCEYHNHPRCALRILAHIMDNYETSIQDEIDSFIDKVLEFEPYYFNKFSSDYVAVMFPLGEILGGHQFQETPNPFELEFWLEQCGQPCSQFTYGLHLSMLPVAQGTAGTHIPLALYASGGQSTTAYMERVLLIAGDAEPLVSEYETIMAKVKGGGGFWSSYSGVNAIWSCILWPLNPGDPVMIEFWGDQPEPPFAV